MSGLQTLAWFTDPWTYLIVGIFALLFFGKRLPEVGRSLGKGIAEFKKGLHDVGDELSREEPEPPPKKKLRAPEPDDEEAEARKLTGGEGSADTKKTRPPEDDA
jgi:sec-independent protein translocase protein TatA